MHHKAHKAHGELTRKKMNILHIIPNLRKGGAERLVLDICNALQRHEDVTVKLITFSELNKYTFS